MMSTEKDVLVKKTSLQMPESKRVHGEEKHWLSSKEKVPGTVISKGQAEA